MHSHRLVDSWHRAGRLHRGAALLVLLAAVLGPDSVVAQGTKADYDRAADLGRRFANKVFRDRLRPQWTADGTRLWYRVETGPGRREFVRVDFDSGQRSALFDHERLAKSLAAAGLGQHSADALPLDSLRVEDALAAIHFRFDGKSWRCDLASYEIKPSAGVPGETGVRLTRGQGPRASLWTGEEVYLTFANRTESPVQLFWLDADGQRPEYARIAAGAEHLQHTFGGHVWLVVSGGGQPLGRFEAGKDDVLIEIDEGLDREAPTAPRPGASRDGLSPDGMLRAIVRDHDVWVVEMASGQPRRLSTDGGPRDRYEPPLLWSPDSKRLLVLRTVPGEDRQVHFVESSPRDQLQPRLHGLTTVLPIRLVVVSWLAFSIPTTLL